MKINIPQHLKLRFAELERLAVSKELPHPWTGPKVLSIGGLTDIGFGESSDLLLCLSHSGRGIIDCISGEVVARDSDEVFPFDIGNLMKPVRDKIESVFTDVPFFVPDAVANFMKDTLLKILPELLKLKHTFYKKDQNKKIA